MQDMGGISKSAMAAVPMIASLLESGKRVLMYCVGSHGRTGSMLAMLIAHLEPEVEDPIAEARARHCKDAVETYSQVAGIFSFANKPVPPIYDDLKPKSRPLSTYAQQGSAVVN